MKKPNNKETDIGLEEFLSAIGSLIVVVLIFIVIIEIIKWLISCASNVPSWMGVIFSFGLGVLPLYLILCFFGVMGDKRDKDKQEEKEH